MWAGYRPISTHKDLPTCVATPCQQQQQSRFANHQGVCTNNGIPRRPAPWQCCQLFSFAYGRQDMRKENSLR